MKVTFDRVIDHTDQLGTTLPEGEVVARHQEAIHYIDVMSDTQDILGTPSADGTAKLWKISTDEVITLTGHQGEVNSLQFSPDGTRVATVSDDMTLRLWDTKTGRPLWRAPLMLNEPPQLFTQQGWVGFAPDSVLLPSTKGWQKAVDLRGKVASASTEQETLCVATYADELEIWDIPNDEPKVKIQQPGIDQVLAFRNGCLTRADGALVLTRSTGERIDLGHKVEAMHRLGDSLFILQEGSLLILDHNGHTLDEFTATIGASALTVVGDAIALGFPDGRIEIWRREGTRSERAFLCRDTEMNSVITIIPGPPGTIIVGFTNGTVGIWSIETGERLYTQRLHGPVIHLLHQNQMLYAATELGSRLRLDLSTFYSDYCDLMERVWSAVPWIWEDGRPRFRERQSDHVCAGSR